MKEHRKATIGLTGGIASGKSSVAAVLTRLGVGIVDADRIAREVVEPGTEGLAEIVRAFGAEVLAADGSLDRKKLGARVFGDEAARKQLQTITHPRIAQRSAERMAELHASAAPYVVYDAPLLVELGAHRGLDALIVVAAAPDAQVERAMRRDGLSRQDVLQRMAAQLPLEQKIAVADYVIHNRGTLEELERETVRVHELILARFCGRTE